MTHPVANGMPGAGDRDLVATFLAAYRDHSNRSAADAAGVSEATVRRWRLGRVSTPLRTRTRLRLRACVGRSTADPAGANDRDRRGQPSAPATSTAPAPAATHYDAPPAGATDAQSPPIELFGSADRVVRYIGSIAPPGQERARKRYALEGIRHVITAWEPLPNWWYQLHEWIESGEI